MVLRKVLFTVIVAALSVVRLSAQEESSQVDSLVRLLSAKSMQLIEEGGAAYRKVTGPARFLHNDTYLICDTALWNVNTNEIFAIDNVKIIQDQTVLTSDKLIYYVDRDLAEFRGALVQLEDKDHNLLRTENLDYNTRDSVAVFFGGGSMKDSEGQIIESETGTYDSKLKKFTFSDNVNMFTDSIFVKSTSMIYDASLNIAHFGYRTDAWQDENMLSSNAGWYDRNREVFLFNKDVHGMSEEQEGWADSLYYYRATNDIELLGNAQVSDTTKDVSALAGRMFYNDSLSRIDMTRDPAIIAIMKSGNADSDTVYFGADVIVSRSVMTFRIDTSEFVNSRTRMDGLSVDAIQTYRQKAARAAAEAASKASENDPNRPQGAKKPGAEGASDETRPAAKADVPEQSVPVDAQARTNSRGLGAGAPEGGNDLTTPPFAAPRTVDADSLTAGTDSLATGADTLHVRSDSLVAGADSLSMGKDSLSVGRDSLNAGVDSLGVRIDSLGTGRDSLGVVGDSLAVRKDTVALDSTKVNFITALGNVKLYKSDIQMACDSLEYTDLDSLVRMYRNPVIWNEGNRQYSADSVYAVIKNKAMDKASLMDNAFIIVKEDESCFDQIKATEMLAYFDSTRALRRFDALGDVNAMFYLQEDSVYATVNKSSAKMLYATFEKGNIDRVYYFDDVKNDAYPVAQMKREDRIVKGFNWLPDKRPASGRDITGLSLRMSERAEYAGRPKTEFTYTDKFFPGYMQEVHKKIADGKLAKQRAEATKRAEREKSVRDSVVVSDSSAVKDSLSLRSPSDSLGTVLDSLTAGRDSLRGGRDSVSVQKDSIQANDVPGELSKEALKAQKAAARAARIAEKEAKWARLDSLDAAKDKAKADKKAAKLRKKKLATLQSIHKQDVKDEAKLERFKESFAKKKEKEDARAAKKAERAAMKPPKEEKPAKDSNEAPDSMASGEENAVEDHVTIPVSTASVAE